VTEFSVSKISSAAFRGAKKIRGGAAEKYRVNLPDLGTVILKLDEESLNGAWVEKIAYELAKLINLPAATYEFAELFDGRRAIISADYLQPNHDEQSGKSLLNQYFGQGNYSYTVDTILSTVDLDRVALPLTYTFPSQVETAADLLAGYLVFDYWIDNIDRHYENWGIQIDTTTARKELLPTYDHGLGLGYLLFEEECLDLDPANYVQNQSSAFSGSKGRSLSMNGMLATVVSLKPEAVKVWMERIAQIDSQTVTELFDRIPEGWIGESTKNFAIELLEFNRQQIASICELTVLELPEIDPPHPDDSPEPPNDFPDPPNPRNPPNSPKPSTPPNSPDPTNSPDPPNDSDVTQSISISIDIDIPGILIPNIDSERSKLQHELQQERQIMTDLEGFHGNAQSQANVSAKDLSKLGEEIGEALGKALGDEGTKRFFQLWDKIAEALRTKEEQEDVIPSLPITAEGLAERKEGLKSLKQRLTSETREFRRDSRKHAIKVGLDYIVSLFKNVKKFLRDTWEAPGKFFRGVKNKFKSLKDFMFQETKGEVKIGRELSGNKQEQAEKFIKLLNTPVGEQAPEGLENTVIAPWGENLIVVDAQNNVTANFIQPLMDSEFVRLAMDKNVVAAAVAPNIQPVANSLASHELGLHGELIGQDAIDRLLANVQNTQLGKSTIQELEAIISEPSQIQLEAPIELPVISLETETSAVVRDTEELIQDPFNELETQPVIITKAQLADLSDDRSDDLKDVIFTSLNKNDEFGSRLEKMQAAADKFISNDEYVALEQFGTNNVQALVQKLESNIKVEEVNIPEFAQHLAENLNSLPQDQEADLKSIQVRTEKLTDAKALLTFIQAKYPVQPTVNSLEQPKYRLIDMSLSELIVERDAKIGQAIIPDNSALTAETRQENLVRVLADPKYVEIQSSAVETVAMTIQTNTERLEYNRRGNLEKIDRKNIKLTEVQQLEDLGEIEDPTRKDRIEDLTQEVNKLTKFDEYHRQELATLTQLTEHLQHSELKPAAFGLTSPPQIPQSPKPPVLDVAVMPSSLGDTQTLTSPRTDFVSVVVTPKLANDLVAIAQLHQIGTPSDNSSLLLLTGNENQVPLSIVHIAQADGLDTYQVVDAGKEFNFTVTPEQIVTNFNINRNNDLSQVRNLVTSIANVVKAPAQTELKPHPDADVQRIETVQQLNDLLDRTITEPDLPAKSVVTLNSERFGVRLDRTNRKVVITDKTSLASMTLSKNGIEDRGLLKKMTDVAKDKSSSLGQRLAKVVVEKTNEIKTAVENAAPNVMTALDERATADRATAQKASKAVNRLGAQIEGYIGQGIRNVRAANPQMFGTVQRMKKIEQVDDAIEDRVKEDLQSAGEHLTEAPGREEESTPESSIDKEREEFQRELNAVVVHKSKAQTSSPAIQSVR
jgi:hypothetical protein